MVNYFSSPLDSKQLVSKAVFILFTIAPLEFSTVPGIEEVFGKFLSKAQLNLDVTQLALYSEKSLDLSVYS